MLLGDSADDKKITFKQMIVENVHLAGTGRVTKSIADARLTEVKKKKALIKSSLQGNEFKAGYLPLGRKHCYCGP